LTERLTIELHNRAQAWDAINARLYPFLKSALQAERRWVLTVKPATRSTKQNARLWAMLTEISEQVDWYGQKLAPEEWKDVFSAAMKRSKVVPGLDGGFVVCGQSTSKMTRAEMSEMQEMMAAFGVEKGVVWRE
jgi:NinB protein